MKEFLHNSQRSDKVASSKKSIIRQSLVEQLTIRKVDQAAFIDLIDDYMSLWETKKALVVDIKRRGVVINGPSSTGIIRDMNNPSVKELLGVNRQMLAIIKELGLTPDQVVSGDDDEL